jgi:hypothetical protein
MTIGWQMDLFSGRYQIPVEGFGGQTHYLYIGYVARTI